jgi:diguanylate cyclase (GGDEF)-like protein
VPSPRRRQPRPARRPSWALWAPPIAALGAGAFASWSPGPAGQALSGALAVLAGGAGVSALCFGIDSARIRRAFQHLRGGGASLKGAASPARSDRHERVQQETVLRLRRQVEQLSAIRDLALIANADVCLERVLERSLQVMGGLLGAREIAVFLLEGEETLRPVGHRLGERIEVASEDGALRIRAREAAQALEERRTIVTGGGRSGLQAATLLVADGEIMGAIEVRLSADPHQVEPRELGLELEGLAKHVALAIRKPTLYDRAVVDGLTRLYTKRHFLEQVEQHMAQRRRLGTPLSLVLLDVDHFKQVNDVHGHVAGDLTLAEVAKRVRSTIRGYDQAFRYGGEEVVIMLPNTELSAAVGLAERLRLIIRGETVDAGEGKQLEIRASFGVAEFDPDAMEDSSQLVEAADQCLYRAKRGGRDRVCSGLDAPEPQRQAA